MKVPDVGRRRWIGSPASVIPPMNADAARLLTTKLPPPDVTYLTCLVMALTYRVGMEAIEQSLTGTNQSITTKAALGIHCPAPSRAMNLVFALTTFLSAFLLFQVQLIVSKHILPWFGGTAAVWTTCMLIFQLLLLGGYVYSHKISTRLSGRRQVLVHLSVLASALLLVIVLAALWPSAVTPSAAWKPPESLHPVFRVMSIILVATGLPFFVLSTTGPLLQRWYARLGGGDQAYRLYAVSNIGSLLGLLTFPFVLEPVFRLSTLGKVWSLLFGCFAVGCAACAWRFRQASAPTDEVVRDVATPSHSCGFPLQFLWFLLAATASALLLAATNLLCQEVTSIPLFWVLPLSIYLLSFVLCFESSRWYARGLFHPVFALSVVTMWLAMVCGAFDVQIVAVMVTIFCAWMICHGELAGLKPGVDRLTSFYLTISLGGAAGGIFVAVMAPVIFKSFIEFQICLAAVIVLALLCLLRDAGSWIFDRRYVLPLAISAGTLLAAYGSRYWVEPLQTFLLGIRFYPAMLLIGLITVMGSFMAGRSGGQQKSRFRFVQLLVAFLVVVLFAVLYATTIPTMKLLTSRRNFYGVVQVQSGSNAKILMHGRTLHGAQLYPPYDRTPVTYYGPDSGIGIALTNHPKRIANSSPLRLGVVGLGVGTLAAYGQEGDYIRYYELDPAVVELSQGKQPLFTFLRDSHAKVDVALGDARLLLESELAQGKRQRFDILVLDAFSGDAVPVHLLTREAFDTYWQQIDPESGIIAVHITSRHVNLLPVMYGLARYYQVPFVVSNREVQEPFAPSTWVLFARRPETLGIAGLGQIILPDQIPSQAQLWTDDRSDIFGLLH